MIELPDSRIDIWQADLDVNKISEYSSYYNILDKEEKEKASKFKKAHHREYYILSHIILRFVLNKYIDITPESIEIQKNKYGKPYVKSNKLQFNLSHSKNKLAIAIALCKIGIDIEYMNPSFGINEVIDITLSMQEYSRFQKLQPNLQRQQFYMYWTQKEAFLKAISTGIDMDLNKLEISDCGIANIDKAKEFITLPFNSFNEDYIGNFSYKGINNKNIQYYNCNDLSFYICE